jgi:hypothetical protein
MRGWTARSHRGSPPNCNTPLFVTLFKLSSVMQKWGPTKTFYANLWKYYFLLICLGCYANNVCLSCLLNNFLNQYNPCALVIMPLFMLLDIFPKPLSWQPLLSHIILFVQGKSQDLPLRQSFYQNQYLQNYWTHKVEWTHYFTNFYFVNIYKRFSNTFKKTY